MRETNPNTAVLLPKEQGRCETGFVVAFAHHGRHRLSGRAVGRRTSGGRTIGPRAAGLEQCNARVVSLSPEPAATADAAAGLSRLRQAMAYPCDDRSDDARLGWRPKRAGCGHAPPIRAPYRLELLLRSSVRSIAHRQRCAIASACAQCSTARRDYSAF